MTLTNWTRRSHKSREWYSNSQSACKIGNQSYLVTTVVKWRNGLQNDFALALTAEALLAV